MMNFVKHFLPFVTLILLCVCPAVLSAQKPGSANISGNVVTSDGNPAEFITVSLKGTLYGAQTDAKGNFRFSAPAGDYTVCVHSISAHEKEFPVVIETGRDNSFPDIEIRESSVLLDKVVITGQFSPQSLRNSVYKVRLITGEQIGKKAATDVQSLLNTELGIRLSNDMTLGETDFEIMGMGGSDVKVLVDGVPVIDRGANRQSLSQIDINTVDRIEIVEGPMSVAYGTDALAGVINIITKKPVPEAGRSTLTVSGGIHEESAGDEYSLFSGKGIHRENVSLGWTGTKGVYLNGNFTRNTSGGWRGDGTDREKLWQPKDQYMYGGMAGYRRGGFNVWYRLDYLDEKIMTAMNAMPSSPEKVSDRDNITDRFTHQLQSDWKINNKVTVNIAASFQDYERITRTTTRDVPTGVKESSQDTVKMKSWFARGTVSWRVSPKVSLQPGVEYKWDEGYGERIDGKPSISDLALFLSAEWNPYTWMSVRPGVRTIVNSDYDAPFAIPALQTKFSLTEDKDLRVSYAYGFRSPALRELYFSFHNDNHNIDGNPDLKAEYSNNFMGSFTWRILHGEDLRLTATLTGFYNDFRDRIAFAFDENDRRHITYYNVDRYKTTGGMLESSVSWRDFYANAGFSLVGRYSRYGGMGALMAADAEFKFSPDVTASAGYKFRTGTDVNLFYKFTGKREEYAYDEATMRPSIRKAKGYSWMDLTVNQKVCGFMTFRAGVKNLFDMTTIENDSGGNHMFGGGDIFVGCGRSYFFGMSFSLTK